jgi:ATP-dependent DNA ligase
MFAQRMDKLKSIDETKKYVVQPKIDGNRCICIKKGNEAKFYTRTGKDIISVPHLAALIAEVPTDFVLDGEIENGGSLEDTGAIRRKDETIENAVYTIFGVYPIDEWESKKHRLPYDRSYKEAKRIVEFIDNKQIRVIPSYPMYPISDEEILLFMQRFLDEGYEGAVIKTFDHVYQPSAGSKRSKDWIKVKPQESTEGIILDIIEGEGLHQGQAGKFKVKWLDVEFEVAPGKFNHEQRIHMLANKQNYISKPLEFTYQCLSQYGVPRHAYAIKIRED